MKALYAIPSNNTSQRYQEICREFPLTRMCQQLYGFQSAMYIPVFNQQTWMASIVLASRNLFAFSQQDMETIQELAASLPLAIENMHAFEELQTLKQQLEQEKIYLTEEIKITHNFGEIIGQSQPMYTIFERIRMVAPLDTTVLITGETGTGKELIARAIHSFSPRNDKPLIKINCAALPSELIESELFGHEKGAFTGAIERRIGKFELAHDGTIFLDEIGELPLELQAKLLRVIQEKEIERIGGKKVIPVNVRII
ncbi:MAG: sigma 54-interacting transcriptional regulator, partial [Bacteroidia bacterium]|nr:sigma 54-interacting transcriptional regulator [Bacteroidia bacterium]